MHYSSGLISAQETNDKGFILVGGRTIWNAQNYQIYLVKTDSFGHGGCDETHTYMQIDTYKVHVNSFLIPTTSVNNPGTSLPFVVGTFGNESMLCFNNAILDPPMSKDLSLSPNPAQNLLTINLSSPLADASVAVYDVRGRKIFLPTANFKSQTSNSIQLNTSGLTNGIYLLQIINSKTGETEVEKFVKE